LVNFDGSDHSFITLVEMFSETGQPVIENNLTWVGVCNKAAEKWNGIDARRRGCPGFWQGATMSDSMSSTDRVRERTLGSVPDEAKRSAYLWLLLRWQPLRLEFNTSANLSGPRHAAHRLARTWKTDPYSRENFGHP